MSAENIHTTLTEDNFDREVLQSNQVVLVDFSADWCGPCRTIAPIVEELAADFDGIARVGKADIDQNASLAEKYS